MFTARVFYDFLAILSKFNMKHEKITRIILMTNLQNKGLVKANIEVNILRKKKSFCLTKINYVGFCNFFVLVLRF